MRNHHLVIVLLFLVSFMFNCRGPEGPAGPPGDGTESLVDPRVQPKVIYTYPPMNSVGPYAELAYPQLQIRFNKMMSVSSLKKAIGISPRSANIRIDTSNIASAGGDFFFLNLRDTAGSYYGPAWHIGQVYTLTVDTSARDMNGNRVFPSVSMTFEPEPSFRVKAMSPHTDGQSVPASSVVELDFNSPIDANLISTIHLLPGVAGNWQIFSYPESTRIGLIPFDGLKNGTTYQLTIDGSAHDQKGNYLAGPFVAQFTTSEFRVVNVYPVSGSEDVYLQSSITLSFSGPIDGQSLKSALKIVPDIPGNLVVSATSNPGFTLTPANNLRTNTQYTITIDTSLIARDGTKLPVAYMSTFTTQPFRVESSYPDDNYLDVPMNTHVSINLNDLLDTGTVRTSFKVNPPLAGTFSIYSPTATIDFAPQDNFAPGTVHTITVDTTLRSWRHDHLIGRHTFSFTTQQFQIIYTTPVNGRVEVDRFASVMILTNAKVAGSTARSSFSIEPPISSYNFYFADGGTQFYFTPTNGFLANTTYTITISTTLKALGGYPLPSAYAFSFTTGN